MAEFERYLAATRRSLPEHIEPKIYEPHLNVVNTVAHTLRDDIDVRFCYTSERRCEAVSHQGKVVIFYDQYLGQTFSNLSRITHESTDQRFGVNYCAKIFSEFFGAFGSLRNAYVCARVHSDKSSKLRNLPKSKTRLVRVFHQERFLMLHEVYHHVLRRHLYLRGMANVVLQQYFTELHRRRKDIYKIPSIFRDDIAPDPDGFSLQLKNELACDYFAFVMCVNTIPHESSIFGQDGKNIAALSCLEALGNSQVIHIMRDVARIRARYNHSGDYNMLSLMRDYQARRRFMNWMCNTELKDCDRDSGNLIGEIDDYLNLFHDNLATVAFSLSESILENGVDVVFDKDASYIDNLLSDGTIGMSSGLKAVDAMTGWIPIQPSQLKARKRILNNTRKYIRRLANGPRGNSMK